MHQADQRETGKTRPLGQAIPVIHNADVNKTARAALGGPWAAGESQHLPRFWDRL